MAHSASGESGQPRKAGRHPSRKVSKLKDLELLEHVPDAMIAVDADGRIVFANSQTEKLFGYTSAELLGQSIELLVPDRVRSAHRSSREDFAGSPHVRPMGAERDLCGVRKDGVEVPLDISLSPIQVTTGPLVIAAVRDITQRKHAEHQLRDAHRRIRRDLDSAAIVQRSLLPKILPNVQGVHFAWAFEPCETLAGDSFSVFMVDDDHVALYLLDVSGHGVAAALQAVALTRVLASRPWPTSVLRRILSPAEVAGDLNREFPIDPETWQYFTFLCATLDVRSSEMRFTSAGHPGPIYVPCDGGPATVDAPGFPIGLFPEASYEEHSLTLKPGDRVYFYSDGATDAMNPDGSDFGRKRLVEAVDACRGVTLENALATVVRTIKDWAGAPGPQDDLTLLGIEVSLPDAAP
jgi:sigma-B regulation protein RsbU (phosphoserine phosphatase)